jgi:hypothetical protein
VGCIRARALATISGGVGAARAARADRRRRIVTSDHLAGLVGPRDDGHQRAIQVGVEGRQQVRASGVEKLKRGQAASAVACRPVTLTTEQRVEESSVGGYVIGQGEQS